MVPALLALTWLRREPTPIMKDQPPSSLDDLDARLRAAREREEVGRPRVREHGDETPNMGLGFRFAIELVVNIVVGAGMGYLLDRGLGTRPWLMIVCLFLGAAAGVMNIYRIAKGLDESVGLGGAVRRKEKDQDP